MRQVVLVVHNVRSAHNVGSILRTADGLGISQVLLTGYTPYPTTKADERLPHIAKRTTNMINKTALGAEDFVNWNHVNEIGHALSSLIKDGYTIAALEQTSSATDIMNFKAPDKIALIVGSEVAGLEDKVLKLVPIHLQIPMIGSKESFNVSVAAAIAAYQLIHS